MKMPDTNKSAHEFWEEVYQNKPHANNGKPSRFLEEYVSDRPPNIALDLGCARGDDSVWLAKQGWTVTAVDISPTALEYARSNAAENEVADKITFEQHDLAKTFPDIRCDLVSAMFLQTPLDFPRVEVLKRAAAALRTGGLLLIVTHGSVAPWSWGDPDETLPTAREHLSNLNLVSSEWTEIFVGSFEREATGPVGQSAVVTDVVIALERR